MACVWKILFFVFISNLTACATKSHSDANSVPMAWDGAESRQKNSIQAKAWGYKLSPVNPSTEDPDGTIRVWHSKLGSISYPTKRACMEAAKKGLEYLAGEAWNFEASCTSPPRASMPIATAAIDVNKFGIDSNPIAHETEKPQQPVEQTVGEASPPRIIVNTIPNPEKKTDPAESQYLSIIVRRIFFPPQKQDSIAPKKRADLSSCDASEGLAMITALQNCWPVMQSYQALGDVMRNMRDHFMAEALAEDSTDDSELQMQTRTLKGADEVIALASERKWPLQDLILIMAHSVKREIYEDTQKYNLALEQLATTESIARSSRMTEPGFELLKDGSAVRIKLLRKKEKAVQAKEYNQGTSETWIAVEELVPSALVQEYGLAPTDLAANPSSFRLNHFVEVWKWLTGSDVHPLMITALGDLIFKRSNGEILLLDTASGTLVPLAESQNAFVKSVSEKAVLDQVFSPKIIKQFKGNDIMLGPNHVYSITKPLNLGGTYTADNFLVIDMDVHFVILGQIHSQIKDLPDGKEIDRFTINN
ncbi:T6SS immunity protein Tdi1 domain-containing protein [Parasphingorhabdus sp.]